MTAAWPLSVVEADLKMKFDFDNFISKENGIIGYSGDLNIYTIEIPKPFEYQTF